MSGRLPRHLVKWFVGGSGFGLGWLFSTYVGCHST